MQSRYKTRLFATTLKEIVDGLNDAQKEAVKELGFGFVLKLDKSNIPNELISWVIQRFDPRRKCLKVHNGQVFFLRMIWRELLD